ncbi:MAG: thymidine phosphorylase [Actinobacteria bacterium]|nr:thymidine phosphorylase [Actinomycetota bacterium]MCI0545014.1 thymidine phosphorylase [Actinomycetota bacterium]MCI0678789.1 thymidine phosphorylase [Actinomycetota bacterium]
MAYTCVEMIETKRDGRKLTPESIEWLLTAYTRDEVPDYQMSALAMAIVFNGLDPEELAAWTEAMLNSGDVMDFSGLPAPKIDKHSTGGVGDKVSIPLAPLAAVCGVAVPMMSGRGLGHTGGTLDKLESIPGFTTRLDPVRFREILFDHGVVLAGQSETIAPADRKLYALRDATGTVPSIPLIASSIMSKKLAEGLDGLVLDVKTGSGAFMKDIERSRELARTMVGIGTAHGVETVALVTSMEQPLGREVGNASEIMESVAVLRGEGPPDLVELTLALGEVMLELGGIDAGADRLRSAIEDGSGLEKLVEVAEAHGGDPSVLRDPDLLPRAPNEDVMSAAQSGYVTRCDALVVGSVATRLGAGRERKEDEIDPGVGITLEAKIGDEVTKGSVLARVRYRDESVWESHKDHLATAWEIGPAPVAPPTLVVERIP